MISTVVRFLNILLVALVAGSVFGIWLGYNPAGLSATAYLEQQQNAIRALNVLMPLLGAAGILLTLASAYLQRQSMGVASILILAAGLLIVGGLVTRFGNQPINAVVIKWGADSMPADWTALRDKWWSFHLMRTMSTVGGLMLIIWAEVRTKHRMDATPA